MAVSGKNAEFTFASTTYDADDCLQSWNLDWSAEQFDYYCNGAIAHVAGSINAVFTTTLALDATDTAVIAALEPGSTGTWEGHPAGDTASYIEFTSTKGTVLNSSVSAPMNGVITMDVTIGLDDCTDAAATS